ncbi:YcbK family protein [Rhizobium sp. Leaf262]|uniref:YcbK family protein n=1 Tax=Rhizobium sp. Leaf262 TaxID=1736312 RepID=UPI000712FA24|nr:YcbK family protein [Rhizobium sp. Leaf262]KQO80778.1 hypothetical protein ASF29_18275 [Rhizobium sp. Leaf262]
MKIVNDHRACMAQRCLAAALLLALSGCVSAVSEDKTVSATATAADPAVAAASPQQPNVTHQGQSGGYVDPAMVSASAARQAAPQPVTSAQGQGTQQVYGQPPQISGLSTQPTGISASSLSIYANSAPGMAADISAAPAQVSGASSIPAYAPAPKVTPALNSVYSAPVVAPSQPTAPAGIEQHSANAASTPAATPALAGRTAPEKSTVPTDPNGVPIAAFFANAARKRGSSATAGLTQVAALPGAGRQMSGIALGGRASMTDEFDDTHVDEDDKPAGLMKLASLSGLSRVAPNGLLVQTEQVNVGCFKPEMIRRIKEVEAHYGRPAMVTSGYRPPRATTQGSKHYTCDAADIQVSGVSKWELSNYLRSLPDRGGVGTYCHTESVHMDLGEPRDWNWRCRRTAKASNAL